MLMSLQHEKTANPLGEPWALELHLPFQPWDVYQRVAHRDHALLLESTLRHPELGRYSFVSADPLRSWIGRIPRKAGATAISYPGWAEWVDALRQYPLHHHPDLPPFQGGLAGWIGYEMAHSLEAIPFPAWDDARLPDYCLGLYDWVIGFDHVQNRQWLIATGWPETDPLAREKRAWERIEQVQQWIRESPQSRPYPQRSKPARGPAYPSYPIPHAPSLTSNFSREKYLKTIERALAYIRAGDCFQVNLAQRLDMPLPADPMTLYQTMRERNPSTFGGLMQSGDVAVISASPERFLKLSAEGELETRPIKGTRSRAANADEDQLRIRELAQSSKDRAENVMIVDLLRNDLGRSCRYGSIEVTALCQVESYPTVHHLVSVVKGRLLAGRSPFEAFKLAFPGGSVTGAPKVRAMEIIAELEPTVRGPYCGSMGYWSFSGAMDTNILIRTLTCHAGHGQFPVGGGIVADSDPEQEYEETLHKAAGWMRTLVE